MTKSECYLQFKKQFPNWLMISIENNYIEIEYNNHYSQINDISFLELDRIKKFFGLSFEDDLIMCNRIVQDTDDNNYLISSIKIPGLHFEKEKE